VDKDLIPTKRLIPEIVDDQGKSVEGPEMERILKLTTEMAQTAQLARIRRALERRQIQGRTFPLTLNANGSVQTIDFYKVNPYTAFATMSIFNNGPSPVYIAVNNSYNFNQVWVNANLPLDYTEADERIHFLAYKCDPGGTAALILVATY
jgi:hypothetical protein